MGGAVSARDKTTDFRKIAPKPPINIGVEPALANSPRDFVSFVDEHLEIPTIPEVAARALREMGSPRTDGPRIAAIIGRDHGLTQRVLQLTNSAAYGLTRKVTSLEHAAMILGFQKLKTIVISASCRQLYRHFGWLEMELWLHSVACAGATQLIANLKRVPHAEEAFVAGLMHDVGKVVMNNAEPERFRAVVELDDAGSRANAEGNERAEFGFTHSEVGALLIRRWELAPELGACVLMHHEPELLATEDDDIHELGWAVVLADEICHREGLGTTSREYDSGLVDSEAAQTLKFTEDELDSLVLQVREAFEADQQLFS